MAEFTAKDVQSLRNLTGAGMMDAKRALTETDGDQAAAAKWLRERGLGKAAERAGRESQEGAVAVSYDRGANAIALVQLRSETDFGAKSPDFVNLVNELAALVAAEGEDAVSQRKEAIEDLNIVTRENVQLGEVARFQAAPGNSVGSYLHVQNDRGVNGVIVEVEGGDDDLAHDIAVHIAFGKPRYLRREDVPSEDVEAERATLETETRNEGKPEAALPKIVEGKLNGWFKRVPGGVLVEQPYAKDDSKTVAQYLGNARIVRFAQVLIGG
ncbi:MAG TPA: translation elongation factor Ts [Acidimicrobiales bacterium]|nr:translation elongation factor Ts [Acidimicrobiales bacterium]